MCLFILFYVCDTLYVNVSVTLTVSLWKGRVDPRLKFGSTCLLLNALNIAYTPRHHGIVHPHDHWHLVTRELSIGLTMENKHVGKTRKFLEYVWWEILSFSSFLSAIDFDGGGRDFQCQTPLPHLLINITRNTGKSWNDICLTPTLVGSYLTLWHPLRKGPECGNLGLDVKLS